MMPIELLGLCLRNAGKLPVFAVPRYFVLLKRQRPLEIEAGLVAARVTSRKARIRYALPITVPFTSPS